MSDLALGDVTRRDLIKGLASIGVGAIAVGMLAGCDADSSSQDVAWTEETDVVVIGSGTGLYTALKLKSGGMSVIVLEKDARFGGSTAFSGSVAWAPNNAVMASEGLEDSRDDAITYLTAGCAQTANPELIEALVDNVVPAIEGVASLAGMEWTRWSPWDMDYQCDLPGGRKAGRSLIPATADGKTIKATTGVLAQTLIAACETAGVDMRTATPATRLMVRYDSAGVPEVQGVIATPEGGDPIAIKARYAVVLAAGGFDWNDGMMTDYLRAPAKGSWGVATGTGDGHHMAQAIGADLALMSYGWMSPGYKVEFEEAKAQKFAHLSNAISDTCKRGLIVVNRHGKRFLNEAADYDSVGRGLSGWECYGTDRTWEASPAYAVCDSETVETYGVGGAAAGEAAEFFVKADTIEELAAKIGVDPANLTATIERFNEYAAQGQDPDFQRGQDYFSQRWFGADQSFEGPAATLKPLTKAPFYAGAMVPVVLGTLGGVKVNAMSQALHVTGAVISRLYAHGNCSGAGAGGGFYPAGGGTIGPSLAFGHIAAEHIRGLTAWE